jgi:non-ribosomal peptide synthetase component F
MTGWPRERVALVFEDQEYTYGRLDDLAGGYAAALAARGVKPGDRVALMGSNRPEWVAAVLGTWRAGAAVALFSPSWKQAEAEHAVAIVHPATPPTAPSTPSPTWSPPHPASAPAPTSPRSSRPSADRPPGSPTSPSRPTPTRPPPLASFPPPVGGTALPKMCARWRYRTGVRRAPPPTGAGSRQTNSANRCRISPARAGNGCQIPPGNACTGSARNAYGEASRVVVVQVREGTPLH